MRRILASLIIVAIAGCLVSCGGGGSGTTAPQTIETQSQLIGPDGGVVSNRTTGISATFAAGSLPSPQRVTLSTYTDSTFPINRLTDAADRPTRITFDTTSLTADGSITFVAPLNGADAASEMFVALSSDRGFGMPVQVAVDSQTQTYTYTVRQRDLLSLIAGDQSSAGTKPVWATLVHDASTPQRSAILSNPYGTVYLWSGTGSASTINNPPKLPGRWGSPIDPETVTLVQAGRLAIVTHGMMNDITNMDPLAFYLYNVSKLNDQRLYSNVIGFSYNWWDNIRDNGNRLAKTIHKLKQRFPNMPIDVFGHSMGGLVARWAIEKGEISGNGPGVGTDVDRLFTFGTPHSGVPEKALRGFGLNLPELKLVNWGISRTAFFFASGVKDLMRERSFIKWINDGITSKNGESRVYAVFAGINNDYLGLAGRAVGLAYSTDSPNDIPYDGIVPLRSAQYSLLANVSQNFWKAAPIPSLNHSLVRGEYQNINGWDINFQQQASYDQQLRPFLLELGSFGVGIQ